MRKRILCLCIALIVTILVAACGANNTAQQPEESTTPENQTPSEPEAEETIPPQPPTPEPVPEISTEDLLQQFESVYKSCGADTKHLEETLAAELETLKSNAADSDVVWPDDYEDQYLRWRARIAAAWRNGLSKSYWDIISQRQPYTYGNAGLVYANYIDPEQSGTPTLMLLSWAPGEDFDQILTLELYGEENGQAVQWWKRDIKVSSFANSPVISLATRNQQVFLSLSYYTKFAYDLVWQHGFYALDQDGAVEKLTCYYDGMTDTESYSNTNSQITQGEYDAQLAAYSTQDEILKLGRLYEEEFPYIFTDGILSGKNEVCAEIEVNGTAVELNGQVYAYGNPYSSGQIMVPFRDVLETMGVAVYANSDASVIIASTKEDTLVIANKDYSVEKTSGSQHYDYYQCYFNGGELGELRHIAITRSDGKLFAALQPLVTLFGADVEWDNEASIVRITSNIPDNIRMTPSEIEAMANFNFDQAAQIAEKEGYPGFSAGGGTPVYHYSFEYVSGRLIFAYGKAICVGYVLDWEESITGDGTPGSGSYYAEWYRVDVMHDGTIIAHPYDKIWNGAG